MLFTISSFSIKKCCNSVVLQRQIARCLSSKENIEVFDRTLKRRQREWSSTADDSEYYDYLRIESAKRLVDRIEDISKEFPLALELGCHRGHVFDLINEKEGLSGTGGIGGVETLIQCDSSPTFIEAAIRYMFNSRAYFISLMKSFRFHIIYIDSFLCIYRNASEREKKGIKYEFISMNKYYINIYKYMSRNICLL